MASPALAAKPPITPAPMRLDADTARNGDLHAAHQRRDVDLRDARCKLRIAEVDRRTAENRPHLELTRHEPTSLAFGASHELRSRRHGSAPSPPARAACVARVELVAIELGQVGHEPVQLRRRRRAVNERQPVFQLVHAQVSRPRSAATAPAPRVRARRHPVAEAPSRSPVVQGTASMAVGGGDPILGPRTDRVKESAAPMTAVIRFPDSMRACPPCAPLVC